MSVLDLHVIQHPGNAQYWEQCLASIETAVACAPFKVSVYKAKAGKSSANDNRVKGFSKGKSPWKTFVDDSDYLTPGSLASLAPYLHSRYAGLFTDYATIGTDGVLTTKSLHNHYRLMVVRADVVENLKEALTKAPADSAISHVMRSLSLDARGVHKIPHVGYVHRRLPQGAGRGRVHA